MAVPKSAPHRSTAQPLLNALSVVANVSAVVGIFLDQSRVIIIIAAALALVLGLYLFMERWSQPLSWRTAFAVVMMLAGTAALAISVDRLLINAPAHAIFTLSDAAGPSAAPASSPSPAAPRLLFSGAVTLTSGDAIDLEAGGRITPNQSLAQGSNDLFLDDTGTITANADHGEFFRSDAQGESQAYARCNYVVTNAKYPSTAAYYVAKDDQFCFKTSDGHLAWFRDAQSELHKKVLSVRVWN